MAGRVGPRLLVAHPSPDLYGSDLQLVETVRAAASEGWRVDVVLPDEGPLTALLEEAGASVRVLPFPVLRKSALSPRGLLDLLRRLPVFAVRAARLLRSPDLVLVNTVTIPWWLAAAALTRTPSLCHVHEAEEHPRWAVRRGLALPLRLARVVVANSQASAAVLTRADPYLAQRVRVVYNGIRRPAGPEAPRPRAASDALRLVQVGRLSPRKGTDVALEAVALLRAEGRDVRLRLCGTAFRGYEWFEQELRARAARPDLAGAVEFLGYVEDPGEELTRADVVLAPSRAEPFGNVAVEALLAQRPLVAARTQGLTEIVADRRTGILVEPGSDHELAAAIRTLADDPDLAVRMAADGRSDAEARFGVRRYREQVLECLVDAIGTAGGITRGSVAPPAGSPRHGAPPPVRARP